MEYLQMCHYLSRRPFEGLDLPAFERFINDTSPLGCFCSNTELRLLLQEVLAATRARGRRSMELQIGTNYQHLARQPRLVTPQRDCEQGAAFEPLEAQSEQLECADPCGVTCGAQEMARQRQLVTRQGDYEPDAALEPLETQGEQPVCADSWDVTCGTPFLPLQL